MFSITFPYWSISNRYNSNQQENVANTRFEIQYKEIRNQTKLNFRNPNILENLFLYWFIKIENLKAKLRSFAINNRKMGIEKTEFHLLYFEILKTVKLIP